MHVGDTYLDNGYPGNVPPVAASKAPDAETWRRTITITRKTGMESTGLIAVSARWQYKNETAWATATERNLQVPAMSLGGRFTKLDAEEKK